MLHPHPPNFHLLQTYSFLSPPSSEKSPVPVEWLVLCGLSTAPFLSLLWRVTPVSLAPAPLPGPYRNALGLVIAFVGAIELYGWLKLPNLTARWPLNGAQRGAALQTIAAAKFLQWRSTITPTQAPIYRQAGGTEGRRGAGGGGGGSGCGGGECECILGRDMEKSAFNSKQGGHLLRSIAILDGHGPKHLLSFFSCLLKWNSDFNFTIKHF